MLDGWWAEAYNGVNGCALGNGSHHVSDDVNDERDGEDLFRVLEEEIIPVFYDRDADGLPQQWIERMKNSINTLAWRFSAHRMVMDYVQKAYVQAAGGLSSDMNIH